MENEEMIQSLEAELLQKDAVINSMTKKINQQHKDIVMWRNFFFVMCVLAVLFLWMAKHESDLRGQLIINNSIREALSEHPIEMDFEEYK